MGDDELEGIAADLASLSERLSDVALRALREALEAGASKRPELERRVSRARASVERAIALLRHAAREEQEAE